jgi:hypothetical protein
MISNGRPRVLGRRGYLISGNAGDARHTPTELTEPPLSDSVSKTHLILLDVRLRPSPVTPVTRR